VEAIGHEKMLLSELNFLLRLENKWWDASAAFEDNNDAVKIRRKKVRNLFSFLVVSLELACWPHNETLQDSSFQV
jgi:hypothetical protein